MKAIWRPTAEQLEKMTGKEVYNAMRDVLKTWEETFCEWGAEAEKTGEEKAKERHFLKGCALAMMLDLTETKKGDGTP